MAEIMWQEYLPKKIWSQIKIGGQLAPKILEVIIFLLNILLYIYTNLENLQVYNNTIYNKHLFIILIGKCLKAFLLLKIGRKL